MAQYRGEGRSHGRWKDRLNEYVNEVLVEREGFKKQRGSDWTGRGGGCYETAILLRAVCRVSKIFETSDKQLDRETTYTAIQTDTTSSMTKSHQKNK